MPDCYWRRKARTRQRIIDMQDRRLSEQDETIANLTASVVQLENDYDAVEQELDRLQSPPVPAMVRREW